MMMRAILFLCCALSVLSVVAGATCPPSGTVCVTQCGTQWQQCSGSTFWAAQSVPSGTVCYDGGFVYPNDARCAGATTQTTTTKPSTTAQPQTTSQATTTAQPQTTKQATTTAQPQTNKQATTTAQPQTTKQATTTAKPQTTTTSAPSGSCSLADIFSQADFNALFPNADVAANRKDPNQYGIFTYDNLIRAAASFPSFACTGTVAQRKKEFAAFLAQTSQETSGWWGGQDYIWGYVYSTELCGTSCNNYCSATADYPCASGKQYYGRGPIQLSWNYNYGQVSLALYGDKNKLINDPDLVLTDGVVAYKTALWFWMTTQSPKPSCHDVITGLWSPSSVDVTKGRLPGFGMLTNIVNGGIECQSGSTPTPQSVNRVGYYTKYTAYFGIPDSTNVYCNNMQNYVNG